MNEQELADLFSEQIDRMLAGESIETVPDIDDLPELLNLGQQISQTQFQASTAAQTAFQSNLATWFGPMNGGSPMTILGLPKIWFISIIIVVVVIITGTGFIALITTSVIIFGSDDPTSTPIAMEPTKDNDDDDDDDDNAQPTPVYTTTVTGTPVTTLTATVPVITTTPSPIPGTPTATRSTDDDDDDDDDDDRDDDDDDGSQNGGLPSIVIVYPFPNINLCQGAYVTQSTLVNYGSGSVTNAALVWEVIEGRDFVADVGIISDYLDQLSSSDDDDDTPTVTPPTDDTTDNAHIYFANIKEISIEQEIDLDINVNVNDSWWEQPDGTEIKVKVSIENRIEISDDDLDWDHQDREPDFSSYDDDDDDFSAHSQIITIVKQGAEWVTLEGFIHEYGEQTYLVDGNIIIVNECTGLPIKFIPGSRVKIIGWLQPDGTFIAINIIVINVNVIIGDFDSGVPFPSSDGDDDDDDDGGGGGGRGGGGGDDDDDD